MYFQYDIGLLIHYLFFPQTPVKVADRLNQLKQEESHIADRDIQKERYQRL